MRLAVLGTGYVGLVAGAGFADFGNDVMCVDIDAEKVARLGRGVLPIYEPGLEGLVKRNVDEQRLSFTTDIARRCAAPTSCSSPSARPRRTTARPICRRCCRRRESIGRAMTGFTVVVTKSTVPVGTAQKIKNAIGKVTTQPFAVGSNPEFLKEGDAVNDFMKPDRVILGTDDERASTSCATSTRRSCAPTIAS